MTAWRRLTVFDFFLVSFHLAWLGLGFGEYHLEWVAY
jgi:hypothetical protein